jgi:serine/threonine protein kinase
MWMAPQAVRNRAKDYKEMVPYGPICDIWSAAVTLYYLLYTKWPFSDKTILQWTVDGAQAKPEEVQFPESALQRP